MIYLDNAATSQKKPQAVYDAVLYAMGHMGNAGRATHAASHGSSKTVFDTRALLTKFFHGDKISNCIFTKNSTESLNIAIQGSLKAGDHVITTVMEHNSVLRPLYAMEKRGVELSFLQYTEEEGLDYDSLDSLLQKNTKAIVCTHASNLTGDMLDLERMGEFAKKHGLLFIVDASQTAGVYEIDCTKWGISILCFTGHKSLLGPQGTGGMIIAPGVEIAPLSFGGTGVETYNPEMPLENPNHLEAGTLNGHGIAGLHAGVEYILETGIDKIRSIELELMERMYTGIVHLPGIRIYGNFKTRKRCPILNLNLYDYDSAVVSDELFTRFSIATRSGGHCAPLMHEALKNVNQGSVRFSFSHFNTKEEVDQTIEALRILSEEG